MSQVQHLKTETFENEVVRSSIPVLVDFYATWCMPCRMLAPVIDKLAGELDGKVKVFKVNVDEDVGLAASYGIHAVPTLLLFAGGKVRERIEGLVAPKVLREKLESLKVAPTPVAGA